MPSPHACEMRARVLWNTKVLGPQVTPFTKQEILEIWDCVPSRFVTAGGERDRYTLFGVNPRARNLLSVAAQNLPWTTRVLTEFVKHVSPERFTFDTVLLREGGNSRPHRDNNGPTHTLVLSLTTNEGGELWIEHPQGDVVLGEKKRPDLLPPGAPAF